VITNDLLKAYFLLLNLLLLMVVMNAIQLIVPTIVTLTESALYYVFLSEVFA
jgi:hypothetical protein